ncbi:MAG: hypothetical protein KAT09_01010 [Candidatus Aegiribacteria sp.]|nr:hypothetical protein [Candidatus Aegiribacteria sp.]
MRDSILVSLSIIITLTGCGTATTTTDTATSDRVFTAVSESVVSESVETATSISLAELDLSVMAPRCAIPGDVEESVPGGEIDWSGNTVRSTGTGVLDIGNANTAQARLMAERAAVVVAQRNLLETVQGIRVDSETRVENFMTDYDVIYTRVEGIVRNARQVGPARYDSVAGIVEVELEMDIHSPQGISGALSSVLGNPETSTVSMSPQTREFLSQYSALVFDGSQAGLQPSMYPRIYDANGNLLLDTRNYAAYLGSGGQTAMQFISDLDQILSQPAFAQSPLVLQVRQITGQFGTDIVLGEADSDKLDWLKEGLPFLMGAGRFLLNVLL